MPRPDREEQLEDQCVIPDLSMDGLRTRELYSGGFFECTTAFVRRGSSTPPRSDAFNKPACCGWCFAHSCGPEKRPWTRRYSLHRDEFHHASQLQAPPNVRISVAIATIIIT